MQEKLYFMKSETFRNTWGDFFAEINKRCLSQNFGTLSKSEFDLLLFHFYLQDKQAQRDGEYVSDYEIGKELGLTIQRVRSLRERDALKWKSEIDWQGVFLSCIKFAHCDAKGDVRIPVPDVNVIKEVRHYLEERGLFDEFQLNPKVFQCPLNVLVAICVDLKNGAHDNNHVCKSILEKLRACKDGSITHAVKEMEHPVLLAIKEGAIIDVKNLLCRIPGVGNTCSKLFDVLLESCGKV